MSTTINPSIEAADVELARRVSLFLAGRHVPALRHLTVEARSGTVTLRGQVRTFYEKQLSQRCIERVAGVARVIDGIDVVPPAHASGRREPAERGDF